jgi:ATP-dependent Lon protease
VLLPGVVLRISIAFRPDIAALLAHIYSTTNVSNSSSSILLGCLPLASPLLGLDGKRLLGDAAGKLAEQARRPQEAEVNMATLDKESLFGFGTLAKVTGVQGRVQGELSLIVEGLSRFRVERFTQERPYFEAMTEQVQDDGRQFSTVLWKNLPGS